MSQTNLYLITYRDSKPEQAKNVVQSLLTIFMESSLGDKRQDTRTAAKFLDDQIKHYEETLQASETRLKDFKLKYLGVAAGRAAPIFSAGSRSWATTSQTPGSSFAPLKNRVMPTSASWPEKRRRFCPNSKDPGPAERSRRSMRGSPPRRVKLDELLRNVHRTASRCRGHEARHRTARGAAQAGDRGSAKGGRGFPNSPGPLAERNPVFQQMRVSLSDAEANVASLKARLAAYESQYAQLKSSARLVPQVEAEFAQLNRDYDVQKKTYGDLLARREATTMGVDVQDTGGTQFRVIDPPRVAPQPVAPTRTVMLSLALLAALGVRTRGEFCRERGEAGLPGCARPARVGAAARSSAWCRCS